MTTLASGQHLPASLALDGTYVYWGSVGDGTVKKVPLGGGSVTTLNQNSSIDRTIFENCAKSTGLVM